MTKLRKFFITKKRIQKEYSPISMFLSAGKFTTREINSIMEYGKPFIKEIKY